MLFMAYTKTNIPNLPKSMNTISNSIAAAILLTFASSAVAAPPFKGGRGASIHKPAKSAQIQKSLKLQFVPISLIKGTTELKAPKQHKGYNSRRLIRGGRGKR